jgi:hypothetical protein
MGVSGLVLVFRSREIGVESDSPGEVYGIVFVFLVESIFCEILLKMQNTAAWFREADLTSTKSVVLKKKSAMA